MFSFAFSTGRAELYEELSVGELSSRTGAWELEALYSSQMIEWQRA